jgi:putative nucleotidyltransferase with HDIG domain
LNTSFSSREISRGDKKAIGAFVFALFSAIGTETILQNISLGSEYLSSLSRVAILVIGFYIIHRFVLAQHKSYRPSIKDLITLALVLVSSVALIWLGRVVAIGLATYAENFRAFEFMGIEAFHYAIPFATGALLLKGILGLHYVMVFALSLSMVVALYFPEQKILVLHVISTCLVAGLSLTQFRTRSAYLKAGLNISIIGFPFALASLFLAPSIYPATVVTVLFGVLLAGVLCAFFAAGLTPIVEYLGGYVTDMRLIEMATLDHPLLKELSIQAPGTWNHSTIMGMMVEAAADEIGANPILSRVGAYFHDIGKIKKPMYFVENQAGVDNRHDKLSSSMSALIIRSHVKDGIELARKHALPKVIEDMIPEHHGTSLIEYFYEKACKEAREADRDVSEVDPGLYSYPGPKPQSREAALLMLADGIEAAARTVSEPNFDKIQGLVQKMINKIFSSGQLNECDLTLRDLHKIAKIFTRVLAGIYHQRVAYAEPAEKISEKALERLEQDKEKTHDGIGTRKEMEGGDQAKREDSGFKDKSREAKKPDQENLKRLGISQDT